MRTLVYNFSQGIDAMTDRRMLPNGFAVVMDNVDLRTGYPKPFKAPAYSQAAEPTTTRIWEFEGKWYLSDRYRNYAGEITQTQQRIYFAEEGPGHVTPQKIVNDVQDALGTPVPQAPLLVSDGALTVPRNLRLAQIVTGNLAVSTLYAYRVAAKMSNGIQQPCQETQITLDATHHAVYLTWDAVPNATGYVVFGRVGSQEQFLKDVGLQLSYLDDGTASPSGAFASTYDSNNPYTYVYTYVRSVGTMEDESGPSPLSVVLNTGNGRILTRQVQVDGYMDGATVVTTSETSLASQFTVQITGMLYQSGGTILTLGAQAFGPWNTGDSLRVIDTASGKDYSINGANMPFNFFDSALAAPIGLAVNLVAGAGSSFATGDYIWEIAAVRGNTVVSTGANASTEVSAPTGSSHVIAGQRVVLGWQQVPGASFYQLYRSADAGVTWNLAHTIAGTDTQFTDTGTNQATGVTPPSVNHTLDRTMLVENVNLPLTVPQPPATTLEAVLSKTVVINGVAQTITQNDSVVLAGAAQSQLNGVQKAFFNVVNVIATANVNISAPGTSTWDGITLKPSTVTVQNLVLLTAQTSGPENGPWVFNGSANPLTRPNWYASGLTPFLPADFPQVYISNGLINAGKLFSVSAGGAITVGTTATTWAKVDKASAFFIAQYSATNDTFTSLSILSGVGHYTFWRIYRSGDTPNFLKVADVPVSQASYEDTVPTTALGVTIPTSYTDNGFVVTFAPPSSDMQQPELFNGMLFMHAGNVLGWSPIGLPDAQPTAFQLTFSYPILYKAAFASGLIVMCQDAIYRVDGFSPTTLGLQKTLIEDGLIAPRSVQKTSHGLIYLARRGVMLTDGNTAICLTENKLPYNFFIQPGTYTEPYSQQDFWWYTTDHTVGYASTNWDTNSPIAYQNTLAATLTTDIPQMGPISAARSFIYRSKYFLYYSDVDPDYKANTMACVDLAVDGKPVTLLGAKVLDAHTTALGDAFVLVGNDGGQTLGANTSISQTPMGVLRPFGGMDFGPDGFLYACWGFCIIKIDTQAKTYSLFAGDYTTSGYTDATGAAARFNTCMDCKWSTDGNLYVADAGVNNYIRKITPAGVVTTLHSFGINHTQNSMAANPSNGDIYTWDATSNDIWKTTLGGTTTSVGNHGSFGSNAMAFDGAGANLYGIAASSDNPFKMTVPGYVITTSSATFNPGGPLALVRRSATTFWALCNGGDPHIEIFDASSLTVTDFYDLISISSPGYYPFAADASSNLFYANYGSPSVIFELTTPASGTQILSDLVAAEAQFNAAFAPSGAVNRSIYKWEGSDQRIPIFIRTGEFNVGLPNERKWWGNLNFHGEGTAQIRVYNDGTLISQATLDAREAPNKPRRINLPNGTKGYGLSFELVGDYNHRATEIAYDLMPNRSGAE